MKGKIPEWLVVALLLGLFAWHVHHYLALPDVTKLQSGAGASVWLAAAGRGDGIWLGIVAAFAFIDVDVVLVARYGAILFAAGTLALSISVARMLRCEGLWTYLPAILLAATPAFAAQAGSGSGETLHVCLTALAFALYLRADSQPYFHLVLGLVMAACAINRVEGGLLAAVLLLHRFLLLVLRDRRKPPGTLLFGMLLFAGACAGFVFASGGVPPLYRVELAADPLAALPSLTAWAHESGVLYASPLLLFGLFCRRGTRQFVFVTTVLLYALLLCGYALATGGRAQLLPLSFVAGLLATLGLRWLAARFKGKSP